MFVIFLACWLTWLALLLFLIVAALSYENEKIIEYVTKTLLISLGISIALLVIIAVVLAWVAAFKVVGYM